MNIAALLAPPPLTLSHLETFTRRLTRNHSPLSAAGPSTSTFTPPTMKTFVRHLRTRPNARVVAAARIPATNLAPTPIPVSILQTTPPPLRPPGSEPLTRWRPTRPCPPPAPDAPPTWSPPRPEHAPREATHTVRDPPAPPKEPRQKPPRLKLADIVPSGLTRYAYRWETIAPTEDQVQHADTFFLRYPPKYLWSQAKFKMIDFGDVPEVAFLGRSNVGKSSLLNALLNNKKLAYTSSKPGRTRVMNAFGIADGKMVLLDMPGYGHASREEWGVQIMKYLKSRKQFRRAFLLIDARHGLKQNDILLLRQFGSEGISFQIVLSKIDRVKPGDVVKLFERVREFMHTEIGGTNAGLGEILATSAAPIRKGEKKVGMSELRWAIMVACGLENVRFGGSRSARMGLEEQLEVQVQGEENQYTTKY